MSSYCVTALRLCQIFLVSDGWPHCLHKASCDYSLLVNVATDVSHSLNLDLSGFLYRALGPQHSVFIMITVQ